MAPNTATTVLVLVDHISTMVAAVPQEAVTIHVEMAAAAVLQEPSVTTIQVLDSTTAPTVHLLEAAAVVLHR